MLGVPKFRKPFFLKLDETVFKHTCAIKRDTFCCSLEKQMKFGFFDSQHLGSKQ